MINHVLNSRRPGFRSQWRTWIADPRELGADLKLWLRADLGVGVSGSNVTGWAEQVSGKTFISGGTPTLTANAVNGRPGIRCNGSAQLLHAPADFSLSLADPYCLIAVGTGGVGSTVYFLNDEDNTGGFARAGSGAVLVKTASGTVTTAETGMNSDPWVISMGSAANSARVNGVTGTHGAVAGTFALAGLNAYAPYTVGDVTICEVIAVARTSTLALYRYIQGLYGIQV